MRPCCPETFAFDKRTHLYKFNYLRKKLYITENTKQCSYTVKPTYNGNFVGRFHLIQALEVWILGRVKVSFLIHISRMARSLFKTDLTASIMQTVCVLDCKSHKSCVNEGRSSGQSFWQQIQRSRVRFPALPYFLRSSGSGTGSTQPREVN